MVLRGAVGGRIGEGSWFKPSPAETLTGAIQERVMRLSYSEPTCGGTLGPGDPKAVADA